VEGTDVETFRPRVTNPKVIMVGRRYSLVHRPGSYLINDTKDPNAPAELFQVGERSQALRRYRQLEAHSTSARLHLARGQAGTVVRRAGRSVRGTLPHRYGRGVPARRRYGGARSWVAARMVPERRGRALVPIVGVLSLGVLVAIMVIAVDPFQPETAAPEFSLGVGEVAAPTITVGSGDPPRAELETHVDEASPPPAAPDEAGHRHEGGRGDASAASGSGSSTGSSIAGSDSSTVQSTGSGGSGGDTSGSGSGGSSDSGSVDQSGGGSSGDSGSGPGGAGPGGGSVDDGGGTGSGGGGGGGGG
jgi:hypothetical protein